MLDWSRVEALRSEVGDDSFAEVVELFLQEADEVVDRLSRATTTDSYEHDLHFLKGSSSNLGFETFSRLCEEGELRAARGGAAELDMGALVASYHATRAHLLDRLRAEGIRIPHGA